MSQILRPRPSYNKYYGDFRGVDFSNDHTQVDNSRLAYSCNMYKNYQSQQGTAIETVPGYRRRFEANAGQRISNIFSMTDKNGKRKVLVHTIDDTQNKGYLILWRKYPLTCNVVLNGTLTLGEPHYLPDGTTPVFIAFMPSSVYEIKSITRQDGTTLPKEAIEYEASRHELRITGLTELSANDVLYYEYYESRILTGNTDEPVPPNDILDEAAELAFPQTAVEFNGKLYIYGYGGRVFDGSQVVPMSTNLYEPTNYINTIVGGENANAGVEYEQRNLLNPMFAQTFIGDGTTTKYYLNEKGFWADGGAVVTVYGENVNPPAYTFDAAKGTVEFRTAPEAPEAKGFAKGYAGIKITAYKEITIPSPLGWVNTTEPLIPHTNSINVISECTISCLFDGRIFLSGNKYYPNYIFYTERNIDGVIDPTYFGQLDYVIDGTADSAITALVPVGDSLMVLKDKADDNSNVFFHTPTLSNNNIQPKIYPSKQGLSSAGCLGAAANFLDDPVFVSDLGLEAVGNLSVKLERAIEHRSSLVDAKLCTEDLSKAKICEWNGFLLILVNGAIYMADSRQRYMSSLGCMQYEWYYLEDIGIYENQYEEFKYVQSMASYLENATVDWIPPEESEPIKLPLLLADNIFNEGTYEYENLVGQTCNPANEEGASDVTIEHQMLTFEQDNFSELIYYVVKDIKDPYSEVHLRYEAYPVYPSGAYIGGTFNPAKCIYEIDRNVFFGTDNGKICSFNFDLIGADGEITSKIYNFDGRTIQCGCATKMDNCGIPGLTKSTVKKSTVIKTKSMAMSAAKVKVRTNRTPYRQISRINSTSFSFDDIDFADFSFITTPQSLYTVKEKEKKWVEKQYYLYSDEYEKPFALFYISYRYNIAGKYKE